MKLRSWLTGSRLTWHRPETRFERSNRILAPQLRGYVRRKVRQPGGESRTTRQLCRRWGRERKSGGKCAQANKIPENTRLLVENIIHVVCAAFLFVVRLGRSSRSTRRWKRSGNCFETIRQFLRNLYFYFKLEFSVWGKYHHYLADKSKTPFETVYFLFFIWKK